MLTKVGTARCSEAEPQCTDVWRNDNGDIVLSNHHGQSITIPLAEWDQVQALIK